MSLNIPDSAKTAFNGMQTGGAVELPFACPPFYIVNGDSKLAALQNFQFFGGWAVSADKLELAADSWDNVSLPIPGLNEVQMPDQNGKTIPSYGARSLIVSPFGIREYSIIKGDNGQERRVAPFTKGGRPGIQIISILGFKNTDGTIFHWAPVMLTAKGYQVNHLKTAIRNWRKSIEPTIKRMVPGTDPAAISNLFWMSIGTFGKERKAEQVGTGANKSSITPISAFIPDAIDETLLEKLYVGDGMAEWMADLAGQAQDWLNVFRNMEPGKSAPSVDDVPEAPPADDDIPF